MKAPSLLKHHFLVEMAAHASKRKDFDMITINIERVLLSHLKTLSHSLQMY
jgi:hypothetical protein